jgi:site-specific recombinase XerD
MSNVVYEDRLYNQDRKFEYLATKSKGTREINARIFKVSQPLEEQLDKDLADFNRDDLLKLFYLFRPATKASSGANVAYVSKYIDWNLELGYKTGTNPLDFVDTEWKQMFANKVLKRFWTRDEINKIIRGRVNHRDKAIIELIFQGVMGTGGSELLNLQRESIDIANHRLHLHDDNTLSRTIPVPEETIDICMNAYNEERYHKANGDPAADIKSEFTTLVENNYIIRTAKTRVKSFNEARVSIVYSALARIAKSIDEPAFTPANIAKSGMLYYLKELYVSNNNQIVDEHYDMIMDRFNDKTEGDLYRLKQDVLNEEVLKSVYQLP